MATTENIGLETVTQAQTVGDFLDAFNGNMGKLDAIALPSGDQANPSGIVTNGNFTSLRLSDGTLATWGRVAFGRTKPCYIAWGTEGFASDYFTVSFPIAFVGEPMAIAQVKSVDSNGDPAPNIDIWAVNAGVSESTYTGRFFARTDTTANDDNLTLNILAIGRWK